MDSQVSLDYKQISDESLTSHVCFTNNILIYIKRILNFFLKQYVLKFSNNEKTCNVKNIILE